MTRKKLSETLEENKYSIELSLVNFLLYIFKISDFIDETRKKKLGEKILKNFAFNDYFSLGLLLDKIDFKNFREKNKEIEKIKEILLKYRDEIVKETENLEDESDFRFLGGLLEKLRKNLKNMITEDREFNEKTRLEISRKIYKPKLDTPKGIQGPFKKDTKGSFLKKDPFDRKFSKNKKKYLDEKTKIEKEDVLFNKGDITSDEKKEEIFENLNFLYENLRFFDVNYLEKINALLKKINKKMNSILNSTKEIV